MKIEVGEAKPLGVQVAAILGIRAETVGVTEHADGSLEVMLGRIIDGSWHVTDDVPADKQQAILDWAKARQ